MVEKARLLKSVALCRLSLAADIRMRLMCTLKCLCRLLSCAIQYVCVCVYDDKDKKTMGRRIQRTQTYSYIRPQQWKNNFSQKQTQGRDRERL